MVIIASNAEIPTNAAFQTVYSLHLRLTWIFLFSVRLRVHNDYESTLQACLCMCSCCTGSADGARLRVASESPDEILVSGASSVSAVCPVCTSATQCMTKLFKTAGQLRWLYMLASQHWFGLPFLIPSSSWWVRESWKKSLRFFITTDPALS